MNSRQHVKPIEKLAEKAKPVTVQPAEIAAASVPPTEQTIGKHRQCPLCWDRCKGVGLAYSTQGNRRYYKCKKTLTDHPPCGHSWTAIVQLEVIRVEHRVVSFEER